jgi:aminoglycoside phosphotransferase (APT) family kinase protein
VDPAPWTPEREVGLDGIRARLDAEQPDLRDQPIRPLGQGWDSVAVRVGEDWVFRFTQRALATRLMVREIAWAPWLRPRLPVPIAAPERWALPTEAEPFAYAGHRWLEGVTGCRASLAPTARRHLAAQVGAFLAGLHGLDVPEDAPPDLTFRADHVRRGQRALDRLAGVAGVDVGALRAEVAPCLEAPLWEGSPCWVHGDLYGRHLLVDEPGSGRLRAVIDWGDVHAGDPAVDLSVAWSFFAGDDREALLAAYGRPVDRAMRDRARLLALDYAGALVPYGEDVGDPAAVELGYLALRCATAP